jgi:hypothetical protein
MVTYELTASTVLVPPRRSGPPEIAETDSAGALRRIRAQFDELCRRDIVALHQLSRRRTASERTVPVSVRHLARIPARRSRRCRPACSSPACRPERRTGVSRMRRVGPLVGRHDRHVVGIEPLKPGTAAETPRGMRRSNSSGFTTVRHQPCRALGTCPRFQTMNVRVKSMTGVPS